MKTLVTTFGNYALDEEIASGQHGKVYRATQTTLNRKTCLKVFSEELSQDPHFKKRLEKVASLLCSLEVEGVARIYEAGFFKKKAFIAAEFLEGFSPIESSNHLDQLMLKVGAILKKLHAKKEAYLGLSRKHVLMNSAGECKLSAFGFAQIEHPLDQLKMTFAKALSSLDDETTSLTLPHIETFFFLSPEQKWPHLHQKPGPPSDWYALGVLGYYLLEGSFPEGSARLSQKNSDKQALFDALLHPDPAQRTLKLTAPKSPELCAVSAYHPANPVHSHIEPILSELVMIEGGSFLCGSKYGPRDEMPRHRVELKNFAIEAHPVTNEQFTRFLEASGDVRNELNNDLIRLKDSRISKSQTGFWIESGYAKHPIVGVTWYGASAYAQWIGRRLPTEAEWEAAAGGSSEALFPVGEKIDKKSANFFGSDTTTVMSYPAGINGLYDMAGNVYEWCSDWYDFHAYDLASQEPHDPKGPFQGVYRVLRGGCWKSLENDLRTAHRHRNNPGAFEATYGFRCVQ